MNPERKNAIEITVNGEARSVADGDTILSLLEDLGLEPARLAVEMDRRIVKQAEWSSTALRACSQLEIVQFVGGG